MSTEINTNAVFSAFIEADKALKELPQVREELARVQDEAKTNADLYHREATKADMLASTIETLRAELAAKEAALSDAMFRHEELSKVVNAISGLLPAKPAVDSPTAVTQATTEQKDSSVKGPTQDHAQAGMDNASSAHVAEHTAELLKSEQTEGQREADPTISALTVQSGADTVTNTHADAPNPAEVSNAEPPHNPLPSPNLTPQSTHYTEAHDSPTSPVPGASLASSNGPSGDAINPLPYADAPYWRKPNEMSWAEFAKLGGNVPNWMYVPDVA